MKRYIHGCQTTRAFWFRASWLLVFFTLAAIFSLVIWPLTHYGTAKAKTTTAAQVNPTAIEIFIGKNKDVTAMVPNVLKSHMVELASAFFARNQDPKRFKEVFGEASDITLVLSTKLHPALTPAPTPLPKEKRTQLEYNYSSRFGGYMPTPTPRVLTIPSADLTCVPRSTLEINDVCGKGEYRYTECLTVETEYKPNVATLYKQNHRIGYVIHFDKPTPLPTETPHYTKLPPIEHMPERNGQ